MSFSYVRHLQNDLAQQVLKLIVSESRSLEPDDVLSGRIGAKQFDDPFVAVVVDAVVAEPVLLAEFSWPRFARSHDHLELGGTLDHRYITLML
jgi:hypothetical protein